MLLAEFTCVEDDSGTWCCINVIRRCIQVSEMHVRNRSYKNSVLPVSFGFFQQQAGSVLGFCFLFLLTLHFLSATRDVLFYLLFLISVLTSPAPYQELIKGLFVSIAKIVIPGNESVKMCSHEIAAAECVLNEMLCSSKSPELSKQVRWSFQIATTKTFANWVHKPSCIPGRKCFPKYISDMPTSRREVVFIFP